MTDEQKPQDANETTMGPSRSTAGLERQYPPELLGAMVTMANACEKSIPPKREIVPDDSVWLSIYCAVANCFNSEKPNAVAWADEGLAEYRKRFRL